MPYIDCPQCHATFHVGVLYASVETCPRCGASLHPVRQNLGEHIRSTFFHRHRHAPEPLDWETVTGSQYSGRQYVTRWDDRPVPHDDRSAA